MLTKYANTGFQARILPSKFLATLAAISYVVSSLSLLILSVDYPILWLAILLLIMKAFKCIFGTCLMNSAQAITFCQQISPKQWRLVNRAGKTILAEQVSHYRSRWLTVITFNQKQNKQKITLALAFDALDKQSYNQLLAKLWQR